ncbi:MAG: DNA cytosine methyltransferase [Taibaiella sp.]|nr:DNA cytosine methyltransferase [Taibaiella sp.]
MSVCKLKTKRLKKISRDEVSQFCVGPHNIDDVIAGIVPRERAPKLLVVDLFCGAGGTSTGFEMTNGEALVIACVNHDYLAIKSHWANYPHIAHFEEDIRTLDLQCLVKLLDHYRMLYPEAKVVLWASLECTNFSKAKGGQPRDADSRTLAHSLYMHWDAATGEYVDGDSYIQLLRPDYIQIENVVEFMSWGPLDENGKPMSRRNGTDFMAWCNEVDGLGYHNEWRELNSADFGAYTSRNRLFGCFAKHGLTIHWPEPTHAKSRKSKVVSSKKGEMQQASFFDMKELKPWKAVKDVLDLKDEGKSIFDREKPLSEKTLERIYAGLVKYVAGGKEAFLLKYNSTSRKGVHHPPSVDEPCPVVAAQNRLGVTFISKHFSGKPDGKNIPVTGPAGTITTSANQSVVSAQFIAQRNSGKPEGRVVDIDGPARTITGTGGNQDVVSANFITCYNGNGVNSGTDAPAPTVTVADRLAVVQAEHFIMRDFSREPFVNSVDSPCGSLTTIPKTNLVTAEPFIMNTNYDNAPSSVEEPLNTITANRKYQYIVNPSHGGHSTSADAPCPVIVARQDKAPLYVVVSEEGDIAVRIDEHDSACMRKIKEFMVLYHIVDIKMRMLKVVELLRIQGFPNAFKLEGSQQDQKKFIGNSVVPVVVKCWAIAMVNKGWSFDGAQDDIHFQKVA